MTESPNELTGTLADEEKAMQKGKGSALAVMMGMAVIIIGGVVMLVSGGDEERVYGELGKAVNGLRRANFDQFWGCALKGENLKKIKSNKQLSYQLDGRGAKGGQRYAVHVREKCMPLLVEIGPQLDTLIIPPDLKEDVDGMRAANRDMRGAWSGYISYLDDEELEFQGEQAKPHIGKISKAWYDFKKAHGSFNKTIKARLQ